MKSAKLKPVKRSTLVILILLCVGVVAFGQSADEQSRGIVADEPAKQNGSEVAKNVPSMGDLLDVVNKAVPESEGGEKSKDEGWTAPVRLAVVFGFLALLPSLLVMMTSFTRIIIVLSFLRRALSTQNIPPTVALLGLSLFLTFFTMAPTWGEINKTALDPYSEDKINFTQAVERSNSHLKDFMLRQTRTSDLELFLSMADIEDAQTQADVPLYVSIPAFAISEFKTAFEIGCLLFIPFLLIDLVVGGILLSAGMMMLPPAMISLPFKIILFVMVDGWRLLIESLVVSFH